MNDSVHFRNARALSEAAKADRVKHDDLIQRVKHLENQLAMYRADIDQLRTMIYGILAARGSGPTARG